MHGNGMYYIRKRLQTFVMLVHNAPTPNSPFIVLDICGNVKKYKEGIKQRRIKKIIGLSHK